MLDVNPDLALGVYAFRVIVDPLLTLAMCKNGRRHQKDASIHTATPRGCESVLFRNIVCRWIPFKTPLATVLLGFYSTLSERSFGWQCSEEAATILGQVKAVSLKVPSLHARSCS